MDAQPRACHGLVRDDPDQVERVLDGLFVFTDLSLMARRDEIEPLSQTDSSRPSTPPSTGRPPEAQLSDVLAETGMLPMFGFPTSVRYLYLSPPVRAFPWPPEDTIDRSLDLAVSQFAPGAEVVRDKAVHVAVGVAAWAPRGGRVVADPGPSNVTEAVSICRTCLYLGRGPAEHDVCPICHEVAPKFGTIDLAAPKGFRTDFIPKDFEGSFEWRPRALTPRIAPEGLDEVAPVTIGRATVRTSRGRIYVLNDNGGRWIWVRDGSRRTGADLGRPDRERGHHRGEPTEAAGAGRRRNPNGRAELGVDDRCAPPRDGGDPPAIDITPLMAARKGAWFSLSFLLRSAAVRVLDVGDQELRAGLRVLTIGGAARGEIFLADALENGAGYST